MNEIEEIEYVQVTVYRREDDPMDESWTNAVMEIVRDNFGGLCTLWNYQSVEFQIYKVQLGEFEDVFSKRGHCISIG